MWLAPFKWNFTKSLFVIYLFIYFLFSFRRYGTKCAGCSLGISPSDLVRRARNKVFHLKCFTCMMCRKELSTGEELYILDENKFICKEDYISSKLSGETSLFVCFWFSFFFFFFFFCTKYIYIVLSFNYVYVFVSIKICYNGYILSE